MTEILNPGGRPLRASTVPRPAVAADTEPRRRGRPRTTGDLRCVRCGLGVPKIRAHWPDGAICGACFTAAVRTRGTCTRCGDEHLLPGRDLEGLPLCRACAGISTVMTCDECGGEAERIRHGSCIRCVLRHDLTALLQPNNPPDLRLRRLIEVLAASERPESIRTWMRGSSASALLVMIGTRELGLDHASFDALPRHGAVDHLRDILTHHHMLPARPDKHLAGFERWLTRRLDSLAELPHVAQPVEQFARWHHLKRLRNPDPTRTMVTAALTARQEITEAGKFLTWLHHTHGLTATDIRQAHVDDYLAGGPSTRKHVRNFLHWHGRAHPGRKVTAPYRTAATTPLITQTKRIELVANCLDFEQVTLSTRIAGLIQLLWAQPLNKITHLTRDTITTHPDGMRITLGEHPSEIPAPISALFWAYLTSHGNQQTTNTGTNWLFPGYRAGHPIHPNTLAIRMRTLGINTQQARNTTLRDLAQTLDARSLADLLDYSPPTLALHAARGGIPMSDYIALKRR